MNREQAMGENDANCGKCGWGGSSEDLKIVSRGRHPSGQGAASRVRLCPKCDTNGWLVIGELSVEEMEVG